MMGSKYPAEWATATVSESCQPPQYGFTASATPRPVGPRFLRITDITDQGVRWNTVPYCECDEESAAKHRLGTGDIVVARIGATTGKSFLIRDCPEAVYASYLIRVRARKGLDPAFLRFFFQSGDYWAQIARSKGDKLKGGVSASVLRRIAHPLPQPSEQRAIASVLSKIQEAIAAQERIIERTRELKWAVMAKLFTEGTRGEPQKMTEIGPMPESWRAAAIRDVGTVVTGTTPPTKKRAYYDGGGFQFISPGDLGVTKRVESTAKKITEAGLGVSRVLPSGSVLVVCIGSSTGKVGMTAQERSATNQQINAIICGPDWNPHFVYYMLDWRSEYTRAHATPSPVPILSKGKFEGLGLSAPRGKEEQDEIAEVLSGLDARAEAAAAERDVLAELFKTMLHELMTGRIRTTALIEKGS